MLNTVKAIMTYRNWTARHRHMDVNIARAFLHVPQHIGA
jgi:hypothetical protein